MSLIDRPLPIAIHRRASAAWRIAAAALLAASAALQLHASAVRWVTAAASWNDPEAGVQDGRYDHSFPSRDWVPLGDAAETHGIGMLLLALAVLAVARAVRITGATGLLGVALVAGSFAAIAANALVAGLTGTATPLGDAYLRVHLLGLVGAVVVAVAVRRGRARGATAWDGLGAPLILGNGLIGQLLALLVIAPAIWGGSYSDTPIHTESVVATSTACAAVAMLVAAVLAHHRGRVPAPRLVRAA